MTAVQAERASTLLVVRASRRGLVVEAINNAAHTELLDGVLAAAWAITARSHTGVEDSATRAVLFDYPVDERHQIGLGAALIGAGYSDVICEFEATVAA